MLRYLSLAIAALPPLCGPAATAADITSGYSDGDTACVQNGVLNGIKGRFAWAEHNTWHRGFVIETLGNPRPSGHPFAEPGLVSRDYCEADAVMTDGRAYSVYYAVEHGLGFAGIGRSVDFCVLGLDPWHVHDGSCRTVR